MNLKPEMYFYGEGKEGLTGIVLSYDKETGEVVTSEARGVKWGSREVTRDISEFTGAKGWKGFFRPKKENADKDNKSNKKGKTTESAKDKFKRIMDQAEVAIRISEEQLDEMRRKDEKEKSDEKFKKDDNSSKPKEN